ncbi:response regulator transcription factor [Azohydromonas aeria]|uniref:response regulator transcription factor n=1 Tax=Azohydromonas aeria TaxID=2590212 RepID=UPI0012FAA07D|nr:response regulator transcription factor [Azohydromonas aeria]
MNVSNMVLVVDDMPQSLGSLCSELESHGYTTLVAQDGESALQRLDLVSPDAILMDALMPGLSGFETCRRLKQDPAQSHIPVIFMTGLSETDHIVEGFACGGVDYVVKPVRVPEVLARLRTHVRNARAMRLAREAADVAGLGVLVLDAHGRIAWRSPQAAAWMEEGQGQDDPSAWVEWANGAVSDPPREVGRLRDGHWLRVQPLGPVNLGERMLLLRRDAAAAPPPGAGRVGMAALTPRETEVLSWVSKGKTNKDIGDILGMSPRTVNKHLEHVFEKLGVETRAAAAALASRELA